MPFVQERMQSKWENVVPYDLSESGVHPATVRDFVDDPAVIEQLLTTELNYAHTNGIPKLREHIAALYRDATPDNVLVTVGCAEANYIALQSLVAPGDEVVIMMPNYFQLWGIAQNLGMKVKAFHLREENGWAPDLDELRDTVTEKTKLIAVCNPNNPTGRILTQAEMDAIVAVAADAGAWLVADEVYRGAERLTDTETPSFWGQYDKVMANNSLSKAYGLPGLRIGWMVGPVDDVEEAWARHDYTTIGTTMLANHLAVIALSSEVRPRLIQRARDYIRRGYPILDGWLESHEGLFEIVPPQAAAIAFARYHLDVNSSELVQRLCLEQGVLIIPGDHFGLDHYLRISYGMEPDRLRKGLDRIHSFLSEFSDPAG